jgi:hypothetical protein
MGEPSMGKFGVGLPLVALTLAGCAQTGGAPETALAPTTMVQREGANLAAAPVAILSLQGAPEAARRDFAAALQKDLGDRGVAMGDSKAARYWVRGYLSARPGEGGADMAYVFDVYDRRHARAARLDASFTVKGEGDAWSLMNGATLDGLATQSADDIAAFLSQTPEAAPLNP